MNNYSLYLRALSNNIQDRLKDEEDRDLLKQSVFYSVKVMNNKSDPVDYDEANSDFKMFGAIKMMIEQVTPNEFISMFPIKKEFDGHKYEVKDYFYVMEYINTLKRDKPIQNANSFMFEYCNDDIKEFVIKMMMNLSHLRQMQGKPSIAKEWAEKNGIETYSKYTDHAGNEFLLNKQGKTQKVIKARPRRHLQLVK